jgi:hypothetical protein
MELYDTEMELYDTEMDISEANNVAGSHPNLVSNLTNLFKAWKTDVTTMFKAPAHVDATYVELDGVPLCFPDDEFGEGLRG